MSLSAFPSLCSFTSLSSTVPPSISVSPNGQGEVDAGVSSGCAHSLLSSVSTLDVVGEVIGEVFFVDVQNSIWKTE